MQCNLDLLYRTLASDLDEAILGRRGKARTSLVLYQGYEKVSWSSDFEMILKQEIWLGAKAEMLLQR